MKEMKMRIEQEAEEQKKRPISKKLLIELLEHLNGVAYISELEEWGIQIPGKEEKQPFGLEKETKQILDEVFSNMTSLDYYNHKRKHPARVGERRSGSSDADFQQLGF